MDDSLASLNIESDAEIRVTTNIPEYMSCGLVVFLWPFADESSQKIGGKCKVRSGVVAA